MAGAGKVTSEFLKNAVVLTPTAKHTATVRYQRFRDNFALIVLSCSFSSSMDLETQGKMHL